MALNASSVQVGAAAMAADINKLTLHSGDPGSSGTANTTTAASQTVVCTAAGGVITVPATNFTGGAPSGACQFVGLWNGTNYRGSYPLTGDQAFNASGAYSTTASTLTGTST